MEEIVKLVVDVIEDKKGMDIKVYDLKGRSPFFDYSILCTGSSTRNVEAIVQELKKSMPLIKGIEGQEESNWVLIDGGDVIVSVFTKDARDYYKLDEFYESV
ncbi:ribosome silencing factor [Streptobacillus moniliformis]|uniref:Ribosomal silencing factor RsfS n=1 Tax=Streptobacillus moniliformis (strain ATCC 14647 / DSM 12112 / NCTC 10651 / 9901) TaxID=519441 RepID=D1AUY8_STRM9|nr:ribosome silencing factor [Streptobacillus moniliformis]ACZ01548.1 iojap-like protein [Streptobacillus moniliformis DSM 12112]AVL43453.1 ribosome silencing factor [Streptobacillus moniliformis]QXW66223.1 ribosome silencing factor [Streptobacillus moniliformis]SQA13285.1 ribosome-associated protein [Streptobacillus moniliformis]SQA14620.1 ribosome-associated protein [Streptobacillus moniliformis]